MTVTFAVLAGGAATRFVDQEGGHQLLQRSIIGVPLVAEVATSIPQYGDDVVVIDGSLALGALFDRVVDVVRDAEWETRCWSSIQCALGAADAQGSDWLVLVPGDVAGRTLADWNAVLSAPGNVVMSSSADGTGVALKVHRSRWRDLDGSRETNLKAVAHDLGVDTMIPTSRDLVEVETPRDVQRWHEAQTPSETDMDWIEGCLGRPMRSRFVVAARDARHRPSVIHNAPFFEDGTPMPTLYWLVDPHLSRRVGTLEATGAIDRLEAEFGLDTLAELHERYRRQREWAIPSEYDGPRPDFGVGGTRRGIKCLHAHYAWYLAGGPDLVGEWVHRQLADAVL